jgi:hypothetical protein
MREILASITGFLTLLSCAGCARWAIPVQVVESETGAGLPNVKATWIVVHRTFWDYKRSVSHFTSDAQGHLRLVHPRNRYENSSALSCLVITALA